MAIKITFKEISHIVYKDEIRENKDIKRVHKGEKYHPFEYTSVYPEEDKVKLSFIREMLGVTVCTAKEDRWHYDYSWFETTELVEEYSEHKVKYDQESDSWYYKPWMEIHFLDGEKRKYYFDTTEELHDTLKNVTMNLGYNNTLSEDFERRTIKQVI